MNDKTVLGRRSRVLYIDKEILYAQMENNLAVSRDLGKSWERPAVKLPLLLQAYFRLHNRLRRGGLYCAEISDDNSMVLAGKGAIYKLDKDSKCLRRPFRIIKGRRPLNLARNQYGVLYWGEYFRNPKREKVDIYASDDNGETWRVIYTFGNKQVRHVHGVFCDLYDSKIWVTTGDRDDESAVWVTANQFRSMEKVVWGTQQARVLQLIFTREHVYFGTDTPFERNHICRINKVDGRVEQLAVVDGSVYWGCKVGEHLFFSTAVEPSMVNKDRYASLWGSPDGIRWQCFFRFKKDPWPIKYFQVGQILFPQGENRTDCLFYTPLAVEGDQTIQRISAADLIPEKYEKSETLFDARR